MVVGTARLVFAIPENHSLKGKRKVVRGIIDRVRHRYNVAVAEVDALDAHQRAVLGLAVVSNDARHANSMLDTVIDYCESVATVPLVDRAIELVQLDPSDEDWNLR